MKKQQHALVNEEKMVEDSQADLLTEASKKLELLRNICEGHEGTIGRIVPRP